MVFCVQAHLLYATAATRDTRLAQAQSFIDGKEKFGETTVVVSDSPDPNAIYIESRFVTRADQEDIENRLLTSVGVQPGSWVQVHDCTADRSPSVLCVVERKTVV